MPISLKSDEISLVIQGPVIAKTTQQLLRTIRKYYPNAEVILSTWDSMYLNQLFGYDILVVNKDPGWEYYNVAYTKKYNINRMLYSSQKGIEKASRKYVLKCRSDLLLHHAHLLKYVDEFKKRDNAYAITHKRLIIGSLFTLKREVYEGSIQRRPLHISDFFCFGLKEDVELLYSVPLVDLKSFARYFEENPPRKPDVVVPYRERLWKFPPEQYLGYYFAKRRFPELSFPNCLDCDGITDELSERIIVNNFIILDPRQSGFFSTKFPYNIYSRLYLCSETIWLGMYRNFFFKKDYKKYCDKTYTVGLDREGYLRKLFQPYHFLKKHLKKGLKKWSHA